MEKYLQDLQALESSLRSYAANSAREVARVERNLKGLSSDDLACLVVPPDEQVGWMRDAIKANQIFLNKIADEARHICTNPPSDPPVSFSFYRGHAVSMSKQASRLLRNFAREWSSEGLSERAGCFEKLLGELDRHVPIPGDGRKPRVLFPGSRLARLACEAQKKGYHCEGSEVDLFFYLGCQLLRREGIGPESCTIHPYALNTCNRVAKQDHVRPFLLPEVAVETPFPEINLGDLVHIYSQPSHKATFDGCVTAFALDTDSNAFRYVRSVAHVLRPGALWTNWGPLNYNVDEETHLVNAVELSWEELRHVISHFFEVVEDGIHPSFLANDQVSMMRKQLDCVFFSAIRNTAEAGLDQVSGESGA